MNYHGFVCSNNKLVAGEAKIGYIYRDELAERPLKTGDLYRIPAGSTFYLVNTALGQRLHVIASIDPSEGLGIGPFQVVLLTLKFCLPEGLGIFVYI